jgi:hypothetical protein
VRQPGELLEGAVERYGANDSPNRRASRQIDLLQTADPWAELVRIYAEDHDQAQKIRQHLASFS